MALTTIFPMLVYSIKSKSQRFFQFPHKDFAEVKLTARLWLFKNISYISTTDMTKGGYIESPHRHKSAHIPVALAVLGVCGGDIGAPD